MASKIHMGDMPELMENIFNNLNTEICTLYSCALVSRHWCKMAVPILWQDPFSSDRSPSFISKYFSSLGEDEKFILKENLEERGINEEFSNTLFDYARFLKVLDISSLEDKFRQWITFKHIESNLFYDTEIYHMINILFKLFIESGATLHKLVLGFSQSFELKPEIFYTLGENKRFFSRIQHLCLDIIYDNNESATTLLEALAKCTTRINTIEFSYFDPDYEPQIFHALINMIKSQEQIKLFFLAGYYSTEFHGIISALESQKNSLQEVILNNCDFSAEFEVLNKCKNLKTLRIGYCTTKLMKLLDYKVSNLEVVYSQDDAMPLIFEKSGNLLQRLKLEIGGGFRVEPLSLEPLPEALRSFCPNITYLSIQRIGFSTQLIELIGNLQKLQFLSLWCVNFDYIPEEVMKIRVIQFSEILPLTLQYFDLGNTLLEPYTDILINHCNAPLKKMLIYRLNNERISKALVEFCMRNKALNYVGVFKYFDLDDNTKKEVEPYVKLVPYEYIVFDLF
ncbi:hypothetical protein C2G38_2244385 [Gigaspora rosea]|uniref:F-box domain-containing protein n=1 Tax=Gigaspora rosea TaxID=44941 RepID=A0A397VIB0_9GLOM|nr:hypothetical protein C2G38_2244385 [Gigaspora rosea]